MYTHFSQSLVDYTASQFKKRRIDVRTGVGVTEVKWSETGVASGTV